MARLNSFRCLIVGLGIACLAGCSAEPERSPAVYRHGLAGASNNLDPLQASDQYAGFLIQNLYQTLYRYKYLARPYELTTDLAADFPVVSADGKLIRISIKPGNRFADDPVFPDGRGREVTAEDVAFSLLRHFDPAQRSQGQWLWRDKIDLPVPGADSAPGRSPDKACWAICAVERYTLVIRLREPFPELVDTLATAFSAVVAKEAVDHYGEELAHHPVGSGPYQLSRLDATQASLRGNPNFVGPPISLAQEGFDPARHSSTLRSLEGRATPLLDQVEVVFNTDATSGAQAFDANPGLDLARIPADQLERIVDGRPPRLNRKYADDYTLVVAPELGFVHLDFNMADPTLGHHADPALAERNRNLRCQLLGVDDLAERNRRFFADMGLVFTGLQPPTIASASAEPVGREPGVPLGGYRPALNYGALAGIRGRQEFEFWRARLVEAGYPIDRIALQSYPTVAALVAGIQANQVNLFMLGWAMDYPNALNNFQLFYGPNGLPGSNFSRFSNTAYDRAFESAAANPTVNQRARAFANMETILAEQCVTLSGITRQSVFVHPNNVVIFPDNGPVNGVQLRFVDKR